MKVAWTPRARADIASLREYIPRDNPAAAKKVAATILTYVQRQLTDYPHSGREGRVADTLELVIPKLSCVVPYRIKGDILEILRVYHAARRWPDQM